MSHRQKNLAFVSLYLSSVENWIEPIRPFLKDAGYRIHIIHIESLSYTPQADVEKFEANYILHEADTQNVNNIDRILASIDPVAVGFLGFQSLFELLLCQMCRDHKIRTFYMQHGHFSEQTFKFLLADKTSSARRYKKLLGLIRQYAGSEKGNVGKGLRMLHAFLRRQYHDIRPDHALLFSPSSYENFNPRFGFPEETVHYCGFPLFKKDSEVGASDVRKTSHALYIHQAFIRNGQTTITYEEERDFLIELAEEVQKHGLSFSVRLHPREDRIAYANRLGSKVDLDTAPSLIEAIKGSSVVVGQSSTALFGAVLLEKPIVLVPYPGLPGSTTGIFSSIGVVSTTPKDAAGQIVNNGNAKQLQEYAAFRDRYIGQHNSHEYWAQTIDKIASAGHP